MNNLNELRPETVKKINGILKEGDDLYSPRFCWITIKKVYDTVADLFAAGYSEPTHIWNDRWDIRGKSLDMNHMDFAAAPKMPIYTVEITEVLQKQVPVLANSVEEAQSLVESSYYRPSDGNYLILGIEDCVNTSFDVVNFTKLTAIQFLMNDGWTYNDAVAVLDEAIANGTFDALSASRLREISRSRRGDNPAV